MRRRDLILLTPDRVAFTILGLLAQKHRAKTLEKMALQRDFPVALPTFVGRLPLDEEDRGNR